MSHVTHINESWMCHVTHINESCHTWTKSHVTHIIPSCSRTQCSQICMNESWHTYEWVIAHIWRSHGTHMNESWHTYEWVMSHICWGRHLCVWHIWMGHHDAHILMTSMCVRHTTSKVYVCDTYDLAFICETHMTSMCVTHMNESCHTHLDDVYVCDTYDI